MFFVLSLLGNDEPPKDNPLPRLGSMAVVLLLTVTPVGYFIRNQVYKAGWQDNIVKPQSYFAGNLIMLSLLEGVAFMGLIATMLQAAMNIGFVVTVIAMSLHVINFPHGKPMFAP